PEIQPIGYLNLRLLSAQVFLTPLPSTSTVLTSHLHPKKPGSYYLRISSNRFDSSKTHLRTPVHYSSGSPTFNVDFQIPLIDYGQAFLISLIDVNDDRTLGVEVMSTQGMLQYQRDMWARSETKEGLFLNAIKQQFQKSSPLTIDSNSSQLIRSNFLRSATTTSAYSNKDIYNIGFYSKPFTSSPKTIGTISYVASIEESTSSIFGAEKGIFPYVPGRPDDDFNVDLTKLHVQRLQKVIGKFERWMRNYFYLISWSNFQLTFSSMIIFILSCLYLNMEYIGAIPVTGLLLNMTIKYFRRSGGSFLEKYTREGVEKVRRKMRGKDGTVHRPIARLKVAVPRGKNLRSRDLGLPGNVYATVSYSPQRFSKEEPTPKEEQIYEIGATATSAITTINPVWNERPRVAHRRLSNVVSELGGVVGGGWKRMKNVVSKGTDKLMSHQGSAKKAQRGGGMLSNVSGRWGDDYVFLYPLLQPVEGDELKPWRSSDGAIVVRVYFENVFNSLMDDCLGEAAIPLKELFSNEREGGEQMELSGYFGIVNLGGGRSAGIQKKLFGGNEHARRKRTRTTSEDINSVASIETEDLDDDGFREDDETDEWGMNEENNESLPEGDERRPQVMVRTQIILKEADEEVTEAEREASITIAQELRESEEKGVDENIIGSSISSVRGAMQNARWIQNLIRNVVEVIESGFNIVSWVDPHKSVLVYVVVALVWFCLIVIKTRHLILIGGMHQFISGWLRSRRKKMKKKLAKESAEKEEGESVEEGEDNAEKEKEARVQLGNPVTNLITMVPNSEDLRRYYFYENFRLGQIEKERIAEKRRIARLRTIWNSKFQAKIGVRDGERWVHGCFLVLQSHRVSWWKNEQEFDNGEECLAQVHWGGHSGLAGLSPLDLKTLSKEEVERSSAIFGRSGGRAVGIEGGVLEASAQAKRLFLFENVEIKDTFESKVLQTIEMGAPKMD
ncbi:hypothetical protein TrLO_g15726, partial [Triparma laevis f. longispina]